jgi:hypothetical protein
LNFLEEEDFPQSNLLQRGGKRPQEERRGCSGGEHNKMMLLLRSSNARWRRMFRREGNFLESKLSGYCFSGIREATGGEERLLWRTAQQNEAPPAEF